MAHPSTRKSHSGIRSQRSILRPGHDPAVRQQSLSLVRATMQKAGFDLEQFNELKRRNDAAMREALVKSKAAADGRAPAMSETVAKSTENWLKANGIGDALAPGTQVYPLSTADSISVDPAFELVFQNIAPWANSAQVILDKRADDHDLFDIRVTFTFSWVNQTGQTNLFTVYALVGVAATCIVRADGYWWPLSPDPPFSRLEGLASLWISQTVNGQVTVPPGESGQAQNTMDVAAHGAFTEGTIAEQDLFRTYILEYDGLLVPANATVEFNLNCEVDWEAREGGVQFFAAGNGRQVTAPGVIIATQPWIIQ